MKAVITRLRKMFSLAAASDNVTDATSPASEAEIDLTRPVLGVLGGGLLVAAAVWIVHPFLPSVIWSVTISVTLWPLVLRLQKILWGSRHAAVFFTVLAALVIFFLPAALIVSIFARYIGDISHFVASLPSWRIPVAPHWVERIPYVGEKIIMRWEQLRDNGLPSLLQHVLPSPQKILQMFLASAGSLGSLLLEFALTLVAMVFILLRAEVIISLLKRVCAKMGGEKGLNLLTQAETTTRGVALGVTLTAILESLFGWIGLMLAGMPMGSVIAAFMFISCVLQFGGSWVLFSSAAGLYFMGSPTQAVIMVVFAVSVAICDYSLQPFIIRRYVRISVIMIMVGAFGGLSSLGFAGVFLGPTLLLLVKKLICNWAGCTPEPALSAEIAVRSDE